MDLDGAGVARREGKVTLYLLGDVGPPSPEARPTSRASLERRIVIEIGYATCLRSTVGGRLAANDGGGMADIESPATGRSARGWPLWVRVVLVAVVSLASVSALVVAGSWLYATRPQETDIDGYAVKDETTVRVMVFVGPGEQFSSAYAVESETTVTLHVLMRRLPGAYLAYAMGAGQDIDLAEPIGDRKVVDYKGHKIPEISPDIIPNSSIEQMLEQTSNR